MSAKGYVVQSWSWDASDVAGAVVLNATVREASSDDPEEVISLRFDGSDADNLVDSLTRSLFGELCKALNGRPTHS